MTYKIPEQPENSFRVTLELETSEPRLDFVLMSALKDQSENEDLQAISLSLIHISEPTRRTPISYAVFCLKKTGGGGRGG